jgi:AcrR family transcriptional regulator
MVKRSAATREAIVAACLETLKQEGYAGTSARAIARRGGFGQALIYYHFEDLEALLLAALQKASTDRLRRYREVVGSVTSVTELAERLTDLYREDVAVGHVKAVQEVVASASVSAERGRRVIDLLQPWHELAENTIERLLQGTAFAPLVTAGDAAYAALALYMGMETMTHLDGDRAPGERLLAALRSLAPLADAVRESTRS